MKRKYLVALFAVSASPCLAQQALVAVGGEGSANSGAVSYSVGQLNYLSAASSTNLVVEGVQQPASTNSEGIAEHLLKDIDITAIPNPTAGYIYLSIKRGPFQYFQYQLTDIGGRDLLRGQTEGIQTAVDLNRFPSGAYLLNVWYSNQLIKSFKIIKNK